MDPVLLNVLIWYMNRVIVKCLQNYRIRQAVGVPARMRELENFGRM